MIYRLLGRGIFATLLVIGAAAAAPAGSQPAETSAEGTARPAAGPASAAVTVPGLSASAGETREDLRELLRRYPPDLARILKLDPNLMTNQTYMAAYPQLSAFLLQHPEVMRSPDYFLEGVWIPVESGPETAAVQLWQTMMDYGAGLLVFGVVTTFLVWLVKTL